MRRYLAIGIEAELERLGSQLAAGGLDLVAGSLPHQQTPADATDKKRELAVAINGAEAGAGLTPGVSGPLRQAVEIPVHQRGSPALRNVAGKGHRARILIDGENRAHHRGIRTGRIMNLDREQQ